MLERIRASIPALPPAEQRVAKLLLSDPRSFATLPVTELAERAHVSKPTVVRFCRSVGYDGLADFKLKLAGNVNEGVPFVHRSVDDDDKAGDLVVKVIDNAVAAMLRYRNAAASQSVERAIVPCWRKPAVTAGASSSTVWAIPASWRRDAQHKFFRLGVNGRRHQRRPYAGDERDDAQARRLCRHLQQLRPQQRPAGRGRHRAQEGGPRSWLLTASGSPLAHGNAARRRCNGAQHILLAADHPEDADRYSPMVSRLLHLLVVDILTTGVALRLGSASLRPMLQEIKRNLRVRAVMRCRAALGAGRVMPRSTGPTTARRAEKRHQLFQAVKAGPVARSLGGAPSTTTVRPAACASRVRACSSKRQRAAVHRLQRRGHRCAAHRCPCATAAGSVAAKAAASCKVATAGSCMVVCGVQGLGAPVSSWPRFCCVPPGWRSGRRCRLGPMCLSQTACGSSAPATGRRR